MNGARNRRAGHDAERALATWLRHNGWPDAATTRDQLGHDGAYQPDGDVIGPVGVTLDVKNAHKLRIPQWLAEANPDGLYSRGRPGLIIAKPVGVGLEHVERWWAIGYVAHILPLYATDR